MEDDYHLQKLLQPPRSCPRCDSDDTKFCYFNNYSLTQPRYFCKGCRRYWTHGGTLRDVPVGGCSHRAKRPRLSAPPPPPLPPPPPPPLPFMGGAGPSPFPGCFVGGFYPSFVAGPSIAVPPPPDMGLLQPYPSFIAGSSANPDQ